MKEKLDLNHTKVPDRYYHDPQNVHKEIDKIVQHFGKFPNSTCLRSYNSGLNHAISKQYGGWNNLYNHYRIPIKEKITWTEELIVKSLEVIIDEIGHFPTTKELSTLKKGDLLHAINTHGGINKFRLEMGYDRLQVPDGYYQDINNVENVINEYIQKFKKEPTIIELDKFKPGIKFAIIKYHGGYIKLKDTLKLRQLVKPDYYWKDFENVRRALDDIKNTIGIFPSTLDIANSKYKGLNGGINKYHGGLNEVRKTMNIPNSSLSKLEQRIKVLLTRYIDCDNYVDNYRKKLFTKYKLELKSPLNNKHWMELDRYYPDFKIAFEIKGEQHDKKSAYFSKGKGLSPEQYLDVIKFLDASKLYQCERQGVTIEYLDKYMSYEKIISIASKYLSIRKKPLPIYIKGEFDNEEYIKDILSNIELSTKSGFVTSDDIKNYSQPLYQELIKRYGNTYNVREYFGLKQIKLPRDYWTLDITISKLKEIERSLGHFPKKEEVIKINRKLYYSIVKYGGLTKFKSKI